MYDMSNRIMNKGNEKRTIKKVAQKANKKEKEKSLTYKVVGFASKLSDGWRALVLLGLMIVSPIIDIASGSVAMMLMLNYDTAMIGISENVLAISLSIFTSGIQILLTMIFTNNGRRKFQMWQLITIGFIMIVDTFIDMTVPFYIFYNEAPFEVVFFGKPLLFYAVMIVFGIACLLSEQILFMIARFDKK